MNTRKGAEKKPRRKDDDKTKSEKHEINALL